MGIIIHSPKFVLARHQVIFHAPHDSASYTIRFPILLASIEVLATKAIPSVRPSTLLDVMILGYTQFSTGSLFLLRLVLMVILLLLLSGFGCVIDIHQRLTALYLRYPWLLKPSLVRQTALMVTKHPTLVDQSLRSSSFRRMAQDRLRVD